MEETVVQTLLQDFFFIVTFSGRSLATSKYSHVKSTFPTAIRRVRAASLKSLESVASLREDQQPDQVITLSPPLLAAQPSSSLVLPRPDWRRGRLGFMEVITLSFMAFARPGAKLGPALSQ